MIYTASNVDDLSSYGEFLIWSYGNMDPLTFAHWPSDGCSKLMDLLESGSFKDINDFMKNAGKMDYIRIEYGQWFHGRLYELKKLTKMMVISNDNWVIEFTRFPELKILSICNATKLINSSLVLPPSIVSLHVNVAQLRAINIADLHSLEELYISFVKDYTAAKSFEEIPPLSELISLKKLIVNGSPREIKNLPGSLQTIVIVDPCLCVSAPERISIDISKFPRNHDGTIASVITPAVMLQSIALGDLESAKAIYKHNPSMLCDCSCLVAIKYKQYQILPWLRELRAPIFGYYRISMDDVEAISKMLKIDIDIEDEDECVRYLIKNW